MCGLCGIVRFDGAPADGERVRRMRDTLAHRGPDAEGLHVDDHVALGHRRLSIIDLDPRSNQPMLDVDGRALVFNGEIYNYRELRRDLQDSYIFQTESDTEVILAAYQTWGPSCVRRFNGDWAIAIYDPGDKTLFLSRDRFGIKPLYYAHLDNGLLFASEVRALVAGGVPGRVSRQTLLDFARSGKNELRDRALVEGVHALEPATSMIVHADGRLDVSRHWTESDLFGADVPSSFDDAVDAFGTIFEHAVRLRLHADVPVGVCLSGGLDSSMITATAARITDHPVRTFSGIAPGYPSDESEYADLVAGTCGTHHTRITLDFASFMDGLRRQVRAQEAPAGGVSPVARMLVLERAGEDVTVLLDGQGGDELLAGYVRFHDRYRELFPDRVFESEPRPPKTRSRIPARSEFQPDFIGDLRAAPPPTPPFAGDTDDITRMQFDSLAGSGLLALLHTEDRLTMARSLEGRVPFLDHRLVAFCFSAPLEYRLHGEDKRLSRVFARRQGLVPHAVIDRRDKLGFATPYAEMLRTPDAQRSVTALIDELTSAAPDIYRPGVLRDLLMEHGKGAIDHSKRLFRAITTLLYLNEFSYTEC